jgi:hypothetical protein
MDRGRTLDKRLFFLCVRQYLRRQNLRKLRTR